MREWLPAIDRSSPVPPYRQLSDHVQAAIVTGRLAAGTRLPDELTISAEVHLSRPTVRRGIQELVDRGLLVRRRGLGTHVVSAAVRRSLTPGSLLDDLNREGQSPRTTVLRCEVVGARADVADRLSLPVRSPVLHLQRLRWANGAPLAILENHLPAALVRIGAEDLEQRGLYDLLRGSGIHISRVQQIIGARAGLPAEGRLLTDQPGDPVLTVDRVGFTRDGNAVEWGRHVYRSALYSVDTTLVHR
jgi:DNA-binding GntR family transcriptional regulator